MQRDDSYLVDMLLAARTVLEYTDGVTWEGFEGNRILQDAVKHQVQVIGEAARTLSPEFREAHAEIPWRDIIGMRNRLVHHYFAIVLAILWEVVQHDIPALVEQLRPFVPPGPSGHSPEQPS